MHWSDHMFQTHGQHPTVTAELVWCGSMFRILTETVKISSCCARLARKQWGNLLNFCCVIEAFMQIKFYPQCSTILYRRPFFYVALDVIPNRLQLLMKVSLTSCTVDYCLYRWQTTATHPLMPKGDPKNPVLILRSTKWTWVKMHVNLLATNGN